MNETTPGAPSGAPLSGPLPIPPQQSHQHRVLPLAVQEVALVQVTFTLKPELLQQAEAAVVPRIDVGFNPVHAERLEGEVDDGFGGFRAEAVSPVCLPQGKADLAALMNGRHL